MDVWDTSALPEGEQFEYYQQVICRAFVPLRPIPVGRPEGFAFRVQTQALGSINRASITSPVQATHRGAAEIAATDNAYYFVNLQLEGRCRTRQGNTESVVEPGAFTVLDTTEPYYLDFDRDWKMLSFRVPHADLSERIGGSRNQLGAAIGNTGAGAAVIALTQTLWSITDGLPGRVAADLGLSFSSAVAAALVDRGIDADEVEPESLRVIVARYLQQNLGDASLTVESVSRVFGLSPRRLHTQFEGSEKSFAATLRAIRMRRAAELLCDRGISVTAIGAAVGYPDPSSFGRVFRRFYGESPQSYRALHEMSSTRARMA